MINAATKSAAVTGNKSREEAIQDSLNLSPYFSHVDFGTNAPAVTNQQLRLRVSRNVPQPFLELELGTEEGLQVQTRCELAKLMEAFVSRSEFDDVLLVNQEQEVLYQLSPGSLRLHRMEVGGTQSYTTNLVNLAGGDFRLFAQPVRISGPADSGSDTLDWILCGLIREERFRQQTWAMDYTVLAAFCFAVLLLVTSWPLLNLLGGGLRGGLGVVEIFLLAFSALFVTALMTLTLLDRFAYHGGKAQLDQRLQTFAANLVTNLNLELKAVAGQLEALDRMAKAHPDWTDLTEILTQPYFLDARDPLYPWLRMVFWTEASGWQTHKWTVKEQNTPMIRVRDRAYFRTIAEGRGWRGGGWTTNVYCIEPIYSRNTGENLAIYATPSVTDSNKVVAIDLKLLTLVRPVIPVGYGFAVLDAKGGVLFHSDEQRNLRENFLTECGNPADLRGRLYGRTSDWLNASYFQKPHRMFITPLKGLPWSLVVFYDKTRLELAEISIASMAGLLFLIYSCTLLLMAVALRLTLGGSAFQWLWPRPSSLASYWLLAGLFLILILMLGGIVLWNPDPTITLGLASIAPLVGAVLAHATLAFGWQNPKWLTVRPFSRRLNVACRQLSRLLRVPWNVRLWRFDHRHGYVLAMGSLLVLAGVMPPLAYFRIAYDAEVTLMIKHAQLQLANHLEAREHRVRMEVRDSTGMDFSSRAALRVSEPQKFVERRVANQWDVHQFNCEVMPVDPGSKLPAANTPEFQTTFARFLRAVRPHFVDLDVEPGGLWPDAAGDASWQWQRKGDALSFWKQSPFGLLHLQAGLPGLPAPNLFWALLGLAVLTLPFGIMFVVSDNVLLLREPEPVRSLPPWQPGKHLLLGPPHAKKSELVTPEHFLALTREPARLDLRLARDRERLAADRADEWFADTTQPIVIDHFEYKLDDPAFNREKLRFLQQFAADERRSLIVISNVHPLLFPLAEPGESTAPEAPALTRLRQQRTELFAAFKRIYKDNELDLALAPLPKDATLFHTRAHFRSLWLTCSPMEQEILHQVARGKLVSGRQPELRPLLERKLLTLRPGLELLPDSRFRRFILANYQPELCEDASKESAPWQVIKAPAVTALIAVAAFFYLTQPALWKHTIGLTPAFIAGIGALTQLLGMFKQPKPIAPQPAD